VCLVYAWPDAVVACTKPKMALVERVDGSTLITKIRDKSAFASIICESQTVRRWLMAQRGLLNCRPGQMVVIPNGIDTRVFDPSIYDRMESRRSLGIGDDEFVIGAVARLAPQKNLGYLLQAFRMFTDRAANRGPKVRLVIAGPDFGSLADLQSIAGELDLRESVLFLSARRDVARLLRAFDVYALTSLSEGTPFSLLEAMAMALPVIATPVGSISEILDNNGFLVDLIQPEDAAGAMIELLEKPELRARLAKRSRQLALRYSYDRMLEGYERVLKQAHLKSSSLSRPGVPIIQ
jgi:glycosyltransferase involved in cell wall biosynthesis